MSPLRTGYPLLVSLGEAGFQLGQSEKDIVNLIRDGHLVAVKIGRGKQILVVYDSLTAFVRRLKKANTITEAALNKISPEDDE